MNEKNDTPAPIDNIEGEASKSLPTTSKSESPTIDSFDTPKPSSKRTKMSLEERIAKAEQHKMVSFYYFIRISSNMQ